MIITARNHDRDADHDVTTQNDEKHLDESCSKISEQYHYTKKRYCKVSLKSCQAMEIAKQWSVDLVLNWIQIYIYTMSNQF